MVEERQAGCRGKVAYNRCKKNQLEVVISGNALVQGSHDGCLALKLFVRLQMRRQT
ncbi:hypothetical protein [Methylobacterium sp. SyP6R]|uniref:hypothetical protein n=1 Tax=Methylobacterium sp. SyP6R TaxID=2718876 RepID=UPI001F38FB2F|nr:hypothetical protein [Methylobacterium sp. SyP6R]MCF4128921.1 hypothetical protein [Methylobacterium sp. SyP6R]